MSKVEQSIEIIEAISSKTDTAIVFLSLGKDSLVVLDLLSEKFKRIICVYMYFVRGLEHIERWVKWTKARYPHIEIVQVPHWTLSYILRCGLYCVPNPKIKAIKLIDVIESVRIKYNAYYVFLGMKKADSMNRRLMLGTYEAGNYENKGLVYPLADWTQKDVLSYMKQKKLPEPVRYSKKASNGLGFNIECFLWLQSKFPNDLKKIYETFPMSERILWEYQNKNKY